MKFGTFDVQHGDRVTFRDARGNLRTGRINGLLVFPTHCVVDTGGPHGTPHVVRPFEIVSVRSAGDAAVSTLAQLWTLSASQCRRLLSFAWIQYRASDNTDALRRIVREAYANGRISAGDIARESARE